MQAAKHRFQSFARPLGRMVRLIRQIIRLMERLARPGQNRDRKCKAAVFPRNVSAKGLLCCACLADISDECMAIVRFTDDEQFDSSQLSHELTLFLRRTVCAAKAGQVLSKAAGCTNSPFKMEHASTNSRMHPHTYAHAQSNRLRRLCTI